MAPNYLAWALLTPLIFRIGRAYPVGQPRWKRAMLILIPLGLILGTLQTLVEEAIILLAGLQPDHAHTAEQFLIAHVLTSLPFNVFIYCAVLGAGYAFDYYNRYRENAVRVGQLERQLIEAKLERLQAQLQPHFLFNTLNAISALVDRDPAATRQMIARVSDLLRLTLDSRDEHEIPLERELTFLRHYVAIEQLRYQDRLSLKWDIQPGLEQALVPNMILQPLVENAIRHGIGERIAGGAVTIRAARDDGRLILEVRDDGPGLQVRETASGVGLSNTQSRLNQLYREGAAFELSNANGQGVTARLTIPYHKSPAV